MKPIRKIIEAETAKWEAEGLISPSVAASIRKRYERDSAAGESRNWAFIVSCSVGALLVGLGIIALLAANWEYLTREMRAAAAVAPVLACALAAYWAAVKKFRSRFFWEATGTLWMMATIAALCIVATTYQVSRDAPALVLAMCLLTLPIVFITRAALPTVGWLVLPIVWYCQKRSHSAVCINAEIIKTFLGFVALEALGAVAVLRTVLAGEYRPLAAFVQLGPPSPRHTPQPYPPSHSAAFSAAFHATEDHRIPPACWQYWR